MFAPQAERLADRMGEIFINAHAYAREHRGAQGSGSARGGHNNAPAGNVCLDLRPYGAVRSTACGVKDLRASARLFCGLQIVPQRGLVYE